MMKFTIYLVSYFYSDVANRRMGLSSEVIARTTKFESLMIDGARITGLTQQMIFTY